MVMRITRLRSAAGASEYYGYDDYYTTGEAEGPGLTWGGRGAAVLGLAGLATKPDFRALLEGWNPDREGPSVSPIDDFLRRQEAKAKAEKAEAEKEKASDEEPALENEGDAVTVDSARPAPGTPGDKGQEGKDEPQWQDVEPDAKDTIDVSGINIRHQPGWDLTFSAPKSLSLAVIGLEKEDFRDIHATAVDQTMAFIEDQLARTRIKNPDGTIKFEQSGNLVWARVAHDLSRDGDAQVHDHVVVLNMTQGEDGKFRALETDQMYKYQELGTLIYQAYLRDGLSRAQIDTIDHPERPGLIEIDGFPRDAIMANSSRRQTITAKISEYMAHLGRQLTGSEKNDLITMVDRKSKLETDRDTAIEAVRARAAELGLDKVGFTAMTGEMKSFDDAGRVDVRQKAVDAGRAAFEQLAYVPERAAQYGIDVASSTSATFHIADALTATMKVTRANITLDSLMETGAIRQGELLKADTYAPGLWTTKTHVRDEQFVLDRMFEAKGAAKGYDVAQIEAMLTRERLDRILGEGNDLNDGQRGAVLSILTSRDGVVALQGYPGTGKTKGVYQVVADVLGELGPGRKFVVALDKDGSVGAAAGGIGPTHTSVAELQKAGVAATTVTRFVNEFDRAQDRPEQMAELRAQWGGALMVVDEGSMIDTPQMARILRAQVSLGIDKVAIGGDQHQIAPHGAGAPFRLMQKAGAETAQLTKILRQSSDIDRTAIKTLADEDLDRAFALIRGSFTEVEPGSDRDAALARAALKHWEVSDRAAEFVTTTNRMKGAINGMVRQALIKRGDVGGVEIQQTVYIDKRAGNDEKATTAPINVGDHLIFHRGVRALAIKPDDNYRVLGIDHQNGRIYAERAADRQRGSFLVSEVNDGKGAAFGVFRKETLDIAEGDRIAFGRMDKDAGVRAGEKAQIEKITDKVVTMKDTDGRTVVLPRDSTLLERISLGYAGTNECWQGASGKSIIYVAPAIGMGEHLTRTRQLVGVSRHKVEVHGFTDSLDAMERSVRNFDGRNTNAVQHLNAPEYPRSDGHARAEEYAQSRGERLDRPSPIWVGDPQRYVYGAVAEVGEANREGKLDGPKTPFVRISAGGRETTLWGAGAFQVLAQNEAAIGDMVMLERPQRVKTGQDRTAMTGVLLEAGPAPFRHERGNQKSFYARLRTGEGDRDLWGLDLKEKLQDFQAGDRVVVEKTKKVHTKKKELVRDPDTGQWIEIEQSTSRTSYQVQHFDDVAPDRKKALEAGMWKVQIFERNPDADRAQNLVADIGEKTVGLDRQKERQALAPAIESSMPKIQIVRSL